MLMTAAIRPHTIKALAISMSSVNMAASGTGGVDACHYALAALRLGRGSRLCACKPVDDSFLQGLGCWRDKGLGIAAWCGRMVGFEGALQVGLVGKAHGMCCLRQ